MADLIPGYGIIGVIGRGATGRVYLAMQLELERRVAIKELSPDLVAVPGFLERFRAEAEVMARLDSPHCVRAIDMIETAGGAYLVQELVLGSSLEGVIATAGKLGAEQALGVVQGSLTGLAYAHSLDLVHRDIKPANILVDLDGQSRLADFGLAAPTGQSGAAGVSLGTAAYMSPEQVEGGEVGPAADIYASGVLLYELLAGIRPFAAADPAVLMRLHLTQAPEPPRGVSRGLADLVMRCLAKDPSGRPASVTELLADLEARAREEYGTEWALRASIATLAATAFAGSGLAVVSGAGSAVGAAGAAQAGATTVGSATTSAASTTAGPAPAAASSTAAAAAAPPAALAAPTVATVTLTHLARAASRRVAQWSVPAKAAAAGAAVVVVAAAVVVATRPQPNLVANAGFETAGIATQVRTIPVARSQGAWLAAGQTQVPVRTTSQPVHSGSASGEVHTPGGGGSGYFLQDVPSLDPKSSYELAAWVYPVTGQQGVEVLYGWDRTGSSTGVSYILVEPGRTLYGAFGTTAIGPSISYRAWHEVRLKVDAGRNVATLLLDGKEVGTTPAGKNNSSGPLTVVLGQGRGGSNPEDHFYYDDVSLTPT